MNREKHHNARIALRLPEKEKQQAETLIIQGKFRNLSELTRVALNEFLVKGDELCPEPST